LVKVIFTAKQSIKRQIGTVHEGKKPFKCNYCDTAFFKKEILIYILYQFMKKTSHLDLTYAKNIT
jgi:hypothetical protein